MEKRKFYTQVSELKEKMEQLEETKQHHQVAFEKWQSATQELESAKKSAGTCYFTLN